MKQRILILFFLVLGSSAYAQKYADLRSGRHGNRMFKKGEWNEAEVDYRRSLDADTSSLKTSYNLASALYRQQRYEEAKALLEKNHDALGLKENAAWEFNLGDLALQMEDYQTAVEAFSQVVVNCPDDIQAKENFVYAKRMLMENPPDPEQQNQQDNGQGDGQSDDNQDNQDQNQDQNQSNQDQNNQNQDQDQNQNDQNQDQNDQDGKQNPDGNQDSRQQDQNLSQQAVDAMLEAIDAKEKDTKEKVDAKKAAALRSSQKEKNW